MRKNLGFHAKHWVHFAPMPSRFLFWILPVFCLLSSPVQAGKLSLQVVLADSSFPAPGPYPIEILENGEVRNITPNLPLTFPLPQDTLWTLCVKRHDSSGLFEQCFEIRYRGSDSLFFARLEGSGKVVSESETKVDSLLVSPSQDSADVLTDNPLGTVETEAIQLKKVVLRAQRLPKRAMGRQTVSAKLIKRMPGLAEADVFRSIQGLPGVVSSSDFSTKIYVRGGGADQNLILFDNAVVYSPVHFFGLFSTFLVEGIDDVTFYKSGFPTEYGNRLSSVLDIKSRKGGKDTADSWFRGSSVKISTVASQVHTEGHQGNLRWLMAGRTTYIKEVVDYLRDQGLLDLTLDYYFYDLQGNMAYNFGKNSDAMLSVYQGRDKLNFDPFLVGWGNTIIPLNFNWRPQENLSSQSTLSYSFFSQDFGLKSIFQFYNKIVTYTGKETFTYSGIEDHRLTVGVEANWMQTYFRNSQYVAKVVLRDVTDFSLVSLYATDKWSLGNWELSPGLRVSTMSKLDEPTAEPRATAKLSLPNKQSLDFHAGYYVQFINSILFGDQETINEFYYPAKKLKYRTLKPASSLLLAMGYAKESIWNQFDFSLEGYYKALDNLFIFAPNDKPDSVVYDTDRDLGDLFVTAEGYSLGFEASLRRPLGKLFGGLSYARGYSVIREEVFKEAYFPKWHQPHSFKGDLALNWIGEDGLWHAKRKGRYFRSSTQVKYASGLPYTAYEGYVPAHLIGQNIGRQAGGPNPEFEGNWQVMRGDYNAAFVPPYFRWDVKPVDWGREGKWNFSFTILNVTGHENIFFYTYDREENPPKRVSISQFPFFPFLLNYEYYF